MPCWKLEPFLSNAEIHHKIKILHFAVFDTLLHTMILYFHFPVTFPRNTLIKTRHAEGRGSAIQTKLPSVFEQQIHSKESPAPIPSLVISLCFTSFISVHAPLAVALILIFVSVKSCLNTTFVA